ncbi:MAG: hypothetical protein U0269_23040 [Polyangiales bacterium]
MRALRWSGLLLCVAAAVTGCGASAAPMDASADRAVSDGASVGADVASDSASDAASEAGGDAAADAALDATRDGASDAASDGASDAASDGASGAPSCNPAAVLCNAIAPVCGRGEAPSVVGGCWGPCVRAETCACARDEECPRVPGFSEVCYVSRGHCGPLL